MSNSTLDYGGESAVPHPVSQTVTHYLRNSISLSDIVRRLMRGWLLALLGAVIGVLLGSYVVWSTPPSYTVTITLLPLEAGSADLAGGGGIGMEVLTSLLGSTGPVPKFTRFVASFSSTGLAAAMDKKYDTICVVFHCDPVTRTYTRHVGFYAWIERTIAAIAHLPDPDRAPDVTALSKYIAGSVIISADKNTKILTLSMDASNPKQASLFLIQLVTAANDYIKDQDNFFVKKEVAYISDQLRTNSDLSQRDALTKMLVDQEQHLMLTAINLPYVALIQDGPTVTSSNRAVKFFTAFVLFGFLIGGALGIALSFVPQSKRFWRSSWKNS